MNQTIKMRIEKISNGEVPEGYTKTSFGIFPCDWEKNKKLKQIGQFGKGKGIPGEKMKTCGVPCVGYGDLYMKYNLHFEQAQCFVDEQVAKESCPIKAGTLLFTGTGETAEEIGKCVCYNGLETIYAGGDIITFVPKGINPMFLAYQQNIKFALVEKSRLGQGHSIVHIQQSELSKLSAAYPTENQEQEKIAEILMKWDEMVEAQGSYIKALELRKKALMQKLLTPKEGWKYISLKKVLKERSVFAGKEKEFTHVTLGKFGVVDKTEQYERDFLVASDDKQYKVTKYNDICYNPANLKFGVICINKYGSAIFSPIYVTFEVIDCYIPDFVAAILSSANFINYIRKYEEGSIYERQAVKVRDFIKGKIYVPSVDKQQRIADILSTVDEEIQLQKKKLAEIKQQRKSLQQLLLTGIARVNYA